MLDPPPKVVGIIFIVMRKLTREEFIAKAVRVHGEQFDYSLVYYVDYHTPVQIICPKHGVFKQAPDHHCDRGQGCPDCKREKLRKTVCGIGVNDADESVFASDAYQVWTNMIKRCYDEKVIARREAYRGCTVCEEWLRLSNFLPWYRENCKPGYQIDKDILIKGNKLYSPETCLGVPRRINALFISARATRGKYPIGVSYRYKKYVAQINYGNGTVSLGRYNTIEEAFSVYKEAKEKYIKNVAQEYYDKREITKRAYDALMRYEVEITD